MMKEIQTARAIFAVLFLFCGFGLIRYASNNRETWCVIVGCLGVLTSILGIIAVFLFLREFAKGFSWDNPPKIYPKSSPLGQPGSGKTYMPIMHISEFQDICEQYGNNNDTCYEECNKHKPCCAEHCPLATLAADEEFIERGMDPSKNDGNYVIPFELPSNKQHYE